MSEDKARTAKAYISSPGYNAPQQVGTERIKKSIEEAGYLPVLPMVSEEIPPREEAENCLASLRESDLVVAWLDGLTAPGVSIYTVGNVETKIEINFPQESIELMQAGAVMMQKMGKGGKKRGIILPGDLDRPPPVPAGMNVDYASHGLALCGLVGKPMNFTDTSINFEIAYAFATGKPIIALAMVNPIIGMYLGWAADTYVDSFAKLDTVLKAYQPVALDPSIGVRRKALIDLQKSHGLDMMIQYRKRQSAAKKVTEEISVPPEAPKKEDATDAK